MKVLIATNSYPTEKNPTHHTYVKNIYDGLKKEGVEVDLIYNQYFYYFESDVKSGNILTSILKTLFIFLGYIPTILYQAKKYDIIYSHSPVWPGFLMLIAQKIYKVKHVIYVHGSAMQYIDKRNLFYKIACFTLNKCTCIVTNSSFMVNLIQDNYKCQSRIISPGYKEILFFYERTERNIDLFFAGSAIKRKRIDLLIEAIAKYKKFYEKRKLNIKMHFSGALKNELIQYSQIKGISDLIEFGDRLTENKLSKSYKKSKVFVFPSTKEPLGLVGIEAIACGAVLVGSNSGGIKEYLIEGKNGFLFDDGDVDDLQKAIEKALIKFPEIENQQPGISQSVSDYSLSLAIKRTISLFQDIAKK